MSELDLYAIGRCQEQVTRENLESSACSVHSVKQHRIYAYAIAIVLLMLINELYRNMTNKYIISISNTHSNQTEIIRELYTNNSNKTNQPFRRCDHHQHHQHHRMLFSDSLECSR